MKNDGGSAFPNHGGDALSYAQGGVLAPSEGMSLLDWFAGEAMKVFLAAVLRDGGKFMVSGSVETAAFDVAEAMIAERERRMKE